MSLAGVSISLFGQVPTPMPILQVESFYVVGVDGFGSAAALVDVTTQVPFEANDCRTCQGTGSPASVSIQTSAGAPSDIDATVYPDQVHVLTSCETFVQGITTPAGTYGSGLPCPSLVTHGDGSLVAAANPAEAGEELVAYATGLGKTDPLLQTGEVVTVAVATQTVFGLDFNYRPNSLATKPLPSAPPPVFAGATPGYVGLYQVNFVVPPVPAGTPPCVDPAAVPAGTNVVLSNLTVSIGGLSSFDGARICVAVPGRQ